MSGEIRLSTRSLSRIAIVAITVIAIAMIGLIVWQQRDRFSGTFFARGPAEHIDPNAYQAVFLTGGQQYFGKLRASGEDYLLLSDVFYLSPQDPGQTPDSQRPLQLLKRGRELHGPRDPMIIPTREVLFIENLRDDSDVVVAIRRFKAGDIPPAPAQTVAPTATPRPSPTR